MRHCTILRGWGSFHHIEGVPKQTVQPLLRDIEDGPKNMSFGGRSPYHKQYIMRKMLTELIRRDFLTVAGTRAHSLARYAADAVKLAKRGDTSSRQQLAYFLLDNYMVDKAFDEFPARFGKMNGNYVAISWLREERRGNQSKLFFVEFRNRAASATHRGDDTEKGPERFFLPQPQLESYRDRELPKHMQMIFDRWACKYKTPEFFTWWKIRHATLRFWGYRNIPHPADVEPLWSEREEEEFQHENSVVPSVDPISSERTDEALDLGDEKLSLQSSQKKKAFWSGTSPVISLE